MYFAGCILFINAGFRAAVMNLGSWPYADPEYHLPGDVPERVDVENLVRSTWLILAVVLEMAQDGGSALRMVQSAAKVDEPFAAFSEWSSEADRKANTDL